MIDKLAKGYIFEQTKHYAISDIQKMALNCGDDNFIHHDRERAKSSRFGEIIASGSAISAVFSAMIPSHISKFSPMLGLEMSFKFSAPIKAGVTIRMVWEIMDTEIKPDKSTVLSLAGKVIGPSDKVLVTGLAKVMLLESL